MGRQLWNESLLVTACVYCIFTCIAMTPAGENDTTISATEMQIETSGFTNALNNFGYKLSMHLMQNMKNTNVLLSPTGITGLLAMVLLGTVGRSYDELSDKLGFSQDVLLNRKNHEQLGQLLEELNINETYSKTLYADVIFVDMQYKLREVYRSYLSKVYHGEAQSVDFKNGEAVKTLINDWVSNNTNGKISMFLKDTLPLDTKVALISTLYFSGQWQSPFLVEHTRKIPFNTSSGDEVLVDQMLNLGRFKYAYSQDNGLQFEMLAFPYNDSVTTLYALKPRFPKKTTLLEILDSIDYIKINNLIDQMVPTECIIRFPKMDLSGDLRLENSLKALGIQAIFSPEANFALLIDENSNPNKTEEELIQKINNGDEDNTDQVRSVINSLPNPGVYVDTVLHSVKMTIDEFGTEASAATGAFLARSVQQFYLNSPFYMFIRNEKTQLVTFSAVINTPIG